MKSKGAYLMQVFDGTLLLEEPSKHKNNDPNRFQKKVILSNGKLTLHYNSQDSTVIFEWKG